jgi:hypothetical protein
MIRHLLKPFWFFLALVFLAEAWLWDHLRPVVAFVVARLPLEAIKASLRRGIARLSPALTLVVFLIPVVLLLPFKIAGLWMLAHGWWFGGLMVLVAAKLVGVGVAAFVFDVTRPKLLQMDWFRRLYELVLRVRDWAHALVSPLMTAIREFARRHRSGAMRHFLQMVGRFRRKVQRPRP